MKFQQLLKRLKATVRKNNRKDNNEKKLVIMNTHKKKIKTVRRVYLIKMNYIVFGIIKRNKSLFFKCIEQKR
jgi:hypothetical protein